MTDSKDMTSVIHRRFQRFNINSNNDTHNGYIKNDEKNLHFDQHWSFNNVTSSAISDQNLLSDGIKMRLKRMSWIAIQARKKSLKEQQVLTMRAELDRIIPKDKHSEFNKREICNLARNIESIKEKDNKDCKKVKLLKRRISVRNRLEMVRGESWDIPKMKEMFQGSMKGIDQLSGMKLARQTNCKFRKPGQATRCFRIAARRVYILIRWMSAFNGPNQKRKEMQTFFDMAHEIDNRSAEKHRQEASGLTFNASYYRASKEIIISTEVKKLLTLTSENRTPEMIQRIVNSLQALSNFSEYPLHMQEKLGRVAWYETVAAGRLILREGHPAEHFYFILSGHAIVKKIEKDLSNGSVSMNIVGRLTKGHSFGEIALLYHSKRTASVESVTKMSLIVIRRDDFMDIFMSPKEGQESDHINYIKKMKFLENWPVEKLNENPEYVLFHFFRRGNVIVHNSKANDWIYVVMSGNCRVITALKAAQPEKIKKGRKRIIPLVELTSPIYESKLYPDKKKFINRKKSLNMFGSEVRSTIGFNDDYSDDEDLPSNRPITSVVTQIRKQKEDGRVKRSLTAMEMSKTNRKNVTNFPKTSTPKPTKCLPILEENDKICYVNLRTMTPTDVFGLEEITFEEDQKISIQRTSVTLISDGAEIVMLKRDFFVKYADEVCRKELRANVLHYPDKSILQDNLQKKVNWTQYQGDLVNDIVQFTEYKKMMLNSKL